MTAAANSEGEHMAIARGATVTVVRGKKVPVGTSGVVFWTGDGPWGPRVGFKTADGVTHWTAAANVEVVGATTALPLEPDMASLAARLAKLEAIVLGAMPATV
jgi:hypothetical protein